MNDTTSPTWEDDIRLLFCDPYWIEEQKRSSVAEEWRQCMEGYLIRLDDYDSVRQWAVTIYEHLRSRAMPLTVDQEQFWPDHALEQLRTWVNQGCRRSSSEPVQDLHLIPVPQPAPKVRIRRNILDLSEEELNEYRAKLKAFAIDKVDPKAMWQAVGYVHTNWCLHYQEAFLLWHRANLLWLEEMIDFPLPYWNFMSPHATEDGHRDAGLPKPFRDPTYVDHRTREELPNPLRFAVAKDGRSKACAPEAPDKPEEESCKFVHRDPVLYTSGNDSRDAREKKLKLIGKFQSQVANALLWPVFSTPEGTPGYPWANIQTFDPPPPDRDYPHKCDFDGLYEHPHDNFHGWVGPDMADNSYTAFDPVFWSYHANIDRLFENWKRAHPSATFTATFPLKPFVGPLARSTSSDPEDFIYTTIGDMAKDSRSLGYDFEPPLEPDATGTMYNEWSDYLYVIFNNVRCILDTYTIDVFLNLPNPTPADMHNENEVHYVGRMTRLGMGVEDDKGRCIAQGVTRILDASYNAYYQGLNPQSEIQLSQIVTDVTTKKVLTPDEYAGRPGFVPIYLWGKGMADVLQ